MTDPSKQSPSEPFPFLFLEDLPPSLSSPLPTYDLTELRTKYSGRAKPDGVRDKIVVLRNIKQSDWQADWIVAELMSRGAPVYYVHTEHFLEFCKMSIRLGEDATHLSVLKLPTGDLALNEVKSVWFRGIEFEFDEPPGLESEAKEFVHRETDAAFYGLGGVLENAFWMNHPDAAREADNRLLQLKRAQALGLAIPQTLLTNDPEQALDFFDACGGKIIVKTLRRWLGTNPRQAVMIYTNRVQKEHLSELERIRLNPCLFQEYIPKDIELRITVIGRHVFAVELHSQRTFSGREDVRRANPDELLLVPVKLVAEVETACLELLKQFRLNFGAIDMIRRPDGTHVFLELNPNAQFQWLQELSHLPLRETIANVLVQGEAEK